MIGTARYASINALKGCEQGRRDDMEALGYVLMYFLRGNLPWQGLKLSRGDDRYKKIYETKMNTTPEQLCVGFPKQFCEFVRYTRNLSFEQEPNYNYLKKLIYDVMDRYEISLDYLFDWGLAKNSSKNGNTNNNLTNVKNTNKNTLNDNNGSNNAVENQNLKIPVKKKQSNVINNKKFNLNKKNMNNKTKSKLNNAYLPKNNLRKNINKNKRFESIKQKIRFKNNIKQNINNLVRSSEKTETKKIYQKNINDNNIFDSLLLNESYISDGAFINESQKFNIKQLENNHYKFLSELNSFSKNREFDNKKWRNYEINQKKDENEKDGEQQDKNCSIF